MAFVLLLCAAVIISCIVANRFSNKIGMPALLLFMAVGMVFGSDGIFRISFDDYRAAEQVCSMALIFIMFYGGFGTKWAAAKPMAVKAGILSMAGTVITALFTCGFCHWALGMGAAESFLTGAVISSTDAASVFSILRSKRLNLKDGTASLLELESGSNDPTAYMLTIIGLTFINQGDTGRLGYLLFAQITYGIMAGIAVAVIGILVFQKAEILTEGLDTVFVIALVMISFALPTLAGGNGYLSVYLTGIILGNSSIRNKAVLVHFFDAITGLAQILLFFLLGLLAFPHKIPAVLVPAVCIALFLTFVARPAAVFLLLLPAKCPLSQCIVVAEAGLRGAASIVFAVMIVADGAVLQNDIFHTVFVISLLSIAFQGSMLPLIARKLNMVDENCDIRKTFTDYQEEDAMTLMRFLVPPGHSWENHTISEVSLPPDSLALMIKRDGETLIPRGDTQIIAGDALIISIPSYREREGNLEEILIGKEHGWCGKRIMELEIPEESLIAMIKRGNENIIPAGKTKILEKDIVVLCR